MKERPILFSAPMIRAILDGRKTQFRRVVKPQPFVKGAWGLTWEPKSPVFGPSYSERNVNWNPITNAFADFYRDRGGSPFGQPGDRLWVREAHAFYGLNYLDLGVWHPIDRDVCCHFREACPVDLESRIDRWRPSIHMPRWASRITLEITSVRVERLQEISEEDAKKEGIESEGGDPKMWKSYNPKLGWLSVDDPAMSYRTLWESINGPGSWDANPWVWVIEFKRLEVAR